LFYLFNQFHSSPVDSDQFLVPQVFSVGFNLVKPFLSAATLAKLRIFSQDAKAWKDALLEEIDADQLPAHYGGTMTDPDGNPFCLTKVSYNIFIFF
jgi:hypothetical protein